ncbi:MAG: hypothetical protein AMK70_09305 [Nitrospira bacterium SG8_35_1]|nr:MAG: hypothetical protein AMK70_09305 [Nitrospira bacterium SG8_35_1]
MKTLNIFEKLFVSVAFAEERIFKTIDWRDLLRKWNNVWVTVAFAEGGIYTDYDDKNTQIPEPYCEIGDIICFMTRNA